MLVAVTPFAYPALSMAVMPPIFLVANLIGKLRVGVGADARKIGPHNSCGSHTGGPKSDSRERRCYNQALLHGGLLSDKGREIRV
jgi:hypothetical protein